MNEGNEIIKIENSEILDTKTNIISLNRKISAPAERIWEVLSTPGHLSYCHPFCEKTSVEKWPGIGSKDTLYFYSGEVANRDFTKWIEGIGYDLNLTMESTGDQLSVIFRVGTLEETSDSVLKISIKINALPKIPKTSRSRYVDFLTRSLEEYLDCVLKGYEYYITTGQVVKRNQFGFHPIFS